MAQAKGKDTGDSKFHFTKTYSALLRLWRLSKNSINPIRFSTNNRHIPTRSLIAITLASSDIVELSN
jgi:hypothetical protein